MFFWFDFCSIEFLVILLCFSGFKICLEEGMVDVGVEYVMGFLLNFGVVEGGDVNLLML